MVGDGDGLEVIGCGGGVRCPLPLGLCFGLTTGGIPCVGACGNSALIGTDFRALWCDRECAAGAVEAVLLVWVATGAAGVGSA